MVFGEIWERVTDPWSAIALLSLLIWTVLLCFWGRFWCGTERLSVALQSERANRGSVNRGLEGEASGSLEQQRDQTEPSVIVVIPARNEAEVIPETLRSILSQRYDGRLRVVLVDDGSTDGTGELARHLAETLPGVTWVTLGAADHKGTGDRLDPDRAVTAAATAIECAVISPPPLPQSWTGKLWALDRGIAAARSHWGDPDYIWLTDADICHPPDNLQRLVNHARDDRRELVSLMVRLRCQSFWERLMVPAFIFFFQKLYPFPWVNDPNRAMAAAAGGCVLLQTAALDRIGGLGCVRQALIDDCALAWAVKHHPSQQAAIASTAASPSSPDRPPYHRIWIGLSDTTHSLRAYDTLSSLWEMVARTAYTQLHYSPLLLIGTILGMVLVYLVPPCSAIGGMVLGIPSLAIVGGLTWGGMVVAYGPTLRSYEQPTMMGVFLPAIASIYLFATIDSAWRHWRGRGGAWKGRTYAQP